MLRRIAVVVLVIVVIVVASGFYLTRPNRLDPKAVAAVPPGNAQAGELVFWAGGCASCHAAPGSKGDALFRLGGGVKLKTDFGTFVTPNISPDPVHGIGKWSFGAFANAVQRGIGPHGEQLYPAFPYTSYARMKLSDVADLFAFLKTLPPVASDPPASTVPFPYSVRRGIALWKTAFMRPGPVIALPDDASAALKRGRYLVEGAGHCGECHTPRNSIGALDYSRWLAGAPSAEGTGTVPNITSGKGGIGSWSEKDIAYFLETGFTPDYDSVGGAMVPVQEDMAKLPASDRAAIAAYLKAVPPQANGYAKKEKK
ncbi:MAG: c-type cytochrome [Pararhizobium sp.]